MKKLLLGTILLLTALVGHSLPATAQETVIDVGEITIDAAETETPTATTRYSGEYPWSTPTVDAASSLFWDAASMHPVGAGAATAIDLGKAAIDLGFGDTGAATTHWHNAQQDALGLIPGVGTVLSAGQGAWDGAMLMDRGMFGTQPQNAPLSSELYDQHVGPRVDQGIDNYVDNIGGY